MGIHISDVAFKERKQNVRDSIDGLLNPETYLGLAREQVDLTVVDIKSSRRKCR